MKAYKVDATANTISEIEISNDYREISKHIGCDLFCSAARLDNEDTLFVDDEGWLNSNVKRAFFFRGELFAGNGIFVGGTRDGKSASVKTSMKKIESELKFMPSGAEVTGLLRNKMLNGFSVTSF